MKKKYGFEGYVVGSDQVWRPKYLPVGLDEYFLSFTEDDNVIRVAYSASFGTDEWEYTKEQTEMSSRLAKKFNNVSVREKSAINLCKSKFGINAIHTLDPTMLLEKSDYIGIVKDEGVEKSPGELLVYLLDKREDNNKLIEIVSKELNIRPFKVNKPTEYEDEQVAKRIAPPVESWLRGFYDAEFILTDSFHGTIFSIIFNKPFIVYANPHRGMARFQSLLDMFNLEDRIIHSISELDINLVKKTLDWKKVNEILNVQRKISHEYLNSLLNITNC